MKATEIKTTFTTDWTCDYLESQMNEYYKLIGTSRVDRIVHECFFQGIDGDKDMVEPEFNWEVLEKKFMAVVNEATEIMKAQFAEAFQVEKERKIDTWKWVAEEKAEMAENE
jgi:hypothetical protein